MTHKMSEQRWKKWVVSSSLSRLFPPQAQAPPRCLYCFQNNGPDNDVTAQYSFLALLPQPCSLQAAILGKESQAPPTGTCQETPSWVSGQRASPAPAAAAAAALGVTWLSSLQQAQSWLLCQEEENGSAFFLRASLWGHSWHASPYKGVFSSFSLVARVPGIYLFSWKETEQFRDHSWRRYNNFFPL